ncbi:Sulfate/thiosulfate import ATP-binding protein CysA [Anaerococcus prevotii]|uniref:ABC-type quaternary amine transporter n=1 Tax=Anaerococcus prevotii (strain ATCC 9321 / DSM 20548 / JCM 6508 / NCTC 11806 / PC1) TaxID=525919 RepID=C7RF47_ANAPD|nr:ABC transporter ATP-binding protein [Anaerococcus prevotii]ACV28108.1 ABC transporter related [Anaerococcus prevotii DSM 20548]SUU93657.1 Sulfate/thiosulfate import ATP-binding protein CysA [Anaerococcus prevotii]
MYLEIKNLSKKYGDSYAVKDISFGLEEGKFLCLLGPSGSGKSTILHSIGGFLDHQGQIIIDGEDISYESPEERDVATVFQSYAIFPHMNVLENVMYGLKFKAKDLSKKEKKERALEVIEKVGLKGFERRYESELSGGQKQRVALARSLVIKPKLLLMDEPLSALDYNLRNKMQEEIKRIQKDFKITTIFVTHDRNEAFAMADEIIILKEGRLIEKASPEEIYNHPKDDFTLNFMGKANMIGGGFVRPEKIREDDKGEEFTIKDLRFEGDRIRIFLKRDNKELEMIKLNDGKKYKIGEKIKVTYRIEEIK